MCGKNTRNYTHYCLGVVYPLYMLYIKLSCLNCCLVVLCVLLSSYVFMCTFCATCVLLFLLQMPDCWLEVSIGKVLRLTTSTQVFLGFPMSISKC